MFIDTQSQETMSQGVCEYLGITKRELLAVLEEAEKKSKKELYIDDVFDDIIDNFIDKKMPKTPIDQVLFFHLSRRLNSTKGKYEGKNLYNILTTENDLRTFLKNHDVDFLQVDNRLDLLYKGELVLLKESSYLRLRLGHSENRNDYCFNGFLLKDLLHKNNYAGHLRNGPEFLSTLALFLKRSDIISNYYENSTFYCLKYCVPMADVLFDENEDLSFQNKQKYLLNQIFNRLYKYNSRELRYMRDQDNPMIRLQENVNMNEKYFLAIEKFI
ncbi:hypothetical protein Q5O14_01800 [Eubacteriaceae bacterium ES2]|nr:hypothetical protein Q5O14_01800 [Eubacteriaceae bacterium ES2]